MKTKEIQEGKKGKAEGRKGKAESRMQRAERERQKGRESARRKDIEALDEDGAENSHVAWTPRLWAFRSRRKDTGEPPVPQACNPRSTRLAPLRFC